MREPDLEDRVVLFPFSVMSAWDPKTTPGWAVHGMVKFVFTMLWMFFVVWWAGPLFIAADHITSSYRKMKRRQKR